MGSSESSGRKVCGEDAAAAGSFAGLTEACEWACDCLRKGADRSGVTGDIGETGVVGSSVGECVVAASEAVAEDTGESSVDVIPKVDDKGSSDSFFGPRCGSNDIGSSLPVPSRGR